MAIPYKLGSHTLPATLALKLVYSRLLLVGCFLPRIFDHTQIPGAPALLVRAHDDCTAPTLNSLYRIFNPALRWLRFCCAFDFQASAAFRLPLLDTRDFIMPIRNPFKRAGAEEEHPRQLADGALKDSKDDATKPIDIKIGNPTEYKLSGMCATKCASKRRRQC
jgi:hypothetical protein